MTMTYNLSRLAHTVIFILILLLGFFLRLEDLGNWGVRWDEAYSVWLSKLSLPDSSERVANASHPPLFNWFFHFWARLVGASEFAIRAHGVLFSAITAATVYCLTWRLSKRNRIAASLALLLISLSPFHIIWSQDGRMYAQVTMFAALTTYAYWRNSHWLLIAAGIGAALTHVFGVIVLASVILHSLIHWRERPDRRKFILSIAVITAVCAVWAFYAFGRMRDGPSFAIFEPVQIFHSMSTLYSVGSTNSSPQHAPIVLLCTVGFFIGLALSWKDNKSAVAFVLIGCILPLIIITLITWPPFPFRVGFIRDRHFVMFAPFVYAGFGIGLAAFFRFRYLRFLGIAASLGLLTLYAYFTSMHLEARYFRDDFRSLMAAVAALTTTDDQIFIITGRNIPFLKYHLDQVGYGASGNADASRDNVVGIPTYASDVPSLMERITDGYPRFWVIEVEAHIDEAHLSPEGPIERMDWLDETHNLLYRIDFGWYNSFSYYSRIEGEIFDRNINVVLAPVITEARPGDFVRIGVPAGSEVQLARQGQVLETLHANTWQLLQFYIHDHYLNGDYALRIDGEERFSFNVTHSQES